MDDVCGVMVQLPVFWFTIRPALASVAAANAGWVCFGKG